MLRLSAVWVLGTVGDGCSMKLSKRGGVILVGGDTHEVGAGPWSCMGQGCPASPRKCL